jgi:hypothetical protein
MWAKRIPLAAARKHRDNLFQVECMFLGLAGLIDKIADEELRKKMHAEYKFLNHKFTLPEPMAASNWHYLRTRPQNFPDVRIRQMARLFHEGNCTLSSIMDAALIEDIDDRLAVAGISKGSRTLIIINTVANLLYAYDLHLGTYNYRTRAVEFLEQLPGEKNYILRQWKTCGMNVGTAYDSQALIQLKKEYCDHAKCLECRFGFEYISHLMKENG